MDKSKILDKKELSKIKSIRNREGEIIPFNIEKIIDDPEIDLIYLGAYDLSVALGIPGDVKNPKVIKYLEDCAKKISAKGKTAGALFHSIDKANHRRGWM